jgi:hypothetical protein
MNTLQETITLLVGMLTGAILMIKLMFCQPFRKAYMRALMDTELD